jgi:glycerol transport system substrate-binding protein
MIKKTSQSLCALGCTFLLATGTLAGPYTEAISPEKLAIIERWVDDEFQMSSLTREQQIEELAWFALAAKPYQDLDIKVLSENITTHKYESSVLAKAFTQITGIPLTHEIRPEGEVIDQLNLQRLMAAKGRYDAFVNDSDLIGTHARSGWALALSDFMVGEGSDVTSPTLDLDDFLGISFVTGLDGKMYQLPDQQFANLYWFRYDWFQRSDLQEQFREIYGYNLGVPINWSAYEDIAEFFSVHVQNIDGKRVYGHMDYGKRDPSLGWRFTDAWFSMAGAGDKGLPNGLPVDEWGIRMEECHPVGATMARGGATNAPASVYALRNYIEWLEKFAPPEAIDMTFGEAGPVPALGQIAQQIFWYTAFTADMNKPGLPVVNADGTPKWRMAPSPRGAYWEDGMKLGYQDVGSWTIPRAMSPFRQKAAWLYAQFATSKTVSLRKTLVGLTPIRKSDLSTPEMQAEAPKLGGLIEFYQSPAREQWTPTGVNVPDYPKLASLWWPNIADAITGVKTPRQALDSLALAQDRAMAVMQRNFTLRTCGPRLEDKEDLKGEEYWLAQPGAPKPQLTNEKPQGETIPYDELVRSWNL